MEEETLKKQKYLQREIISEGYDPEQFADYITQFHEDGRRG
jgi:hypothetical protein